MFTHKSDDEKPLCYIKEPPINADIETFFVNYASIQPSALRDHLVAVRERVWQRYNYPCLGRWRFLHFSIKQSPIYQEILEKCKHEGATLTDFGCCLGQDVRQLVYDGVPLDQIRGYDLNPFFIEQGYELFRDGELMKEKKIFASGDIFDNQFLDGIEPSDYVYASSLIHLFNAETQRDVCRRLTRIAKQAIAGRQVGALVAEERPGLERGITDAKMMWHSPESFTRMWNDATNGEWQVESATFKMMDDMKLSHEGFVFVVRKRKTQ